MQAADVSKLHNEVTMLRKKLAGTENTLAKQGNDLKGQVANLKSKLAQTERDLNDSQIQCVFFPSLFHLGFFRAPANSEQGGTTSTSQVVRVLVK